MRKDLRRRHSEFLRIAHWRLSPCLNRDAISLLATPLSASSLREFPLSTVVRDIPDNTIS